ncbi:hypothetical protein FZ103_01915 [Streptomonospora sp. PA3]|uniref:hypothetical protein n=1 Tax=Streptomonospora sp. PA3 TaxID=2607326 RepID=UPI0012DF74B1|nr:hypothetical protein [Streptomonospora sp. PA3]MUL39945.1 hypothetical protein [Streptomonospora sp. PA3]
MDTRRRGRALAPESFSDAVRRRLWNLDRLREVWTERRRYGDRAEDPAVNRRSARKRVEALRLLAGQDEPPADGIAAQEDAFLAMAEDCRSGVRLSPDYFDALARSVPDFAPTLPAPAGAGALLAEAAAVETHPVIRAAHLFLTCADALDSGSEPVPGPRPAAEQDPSAADTRPPGPAPGRAAPPASLRPLPWWLASLALMRSDFPPPAIDRRSPPPLAAPLPTAEPGAAVPSPRSGHDRLTRLVLLLADLETAALRSELSRLAHVRAIGRSESGRLASAVHRRVLEHLRVRSAPMRLVLRELDPACRTVVSSSTAGPAFTSPGDPAGVGAAGSPPEGAPGDSATATTTRTAVAPSTAERSGQAARRALFTPGANEWHASLDVDLADGVLRLLVFVQEVGSTATGVLAVTADGWMTTDEGAVDVLDPGCADCVTLLPTDGADDRWPEVEAFVDDVLSRSISQLTRAARY